MQQMCQVPGSIPWRIPNIRRVISSAGITRFLFSLPEPLSEGKKSYISRIHRKIASLSLPGILAPVQEVENAYLVDCGLYKMISVQELISKYSAQETDWMILDLAGKLQSLHNNGILAISVSPAYLLVNDEGEHIRCAMTGFLDAIDLSMPYSVSEADLYNRFLVAPEVIAWTRESDSLTAASDVYSLGLLYHLLLTGSMPETDEDNTGKEDQDEIRLSRRLDIPHRDLLSMMLSDNPAQRPQSMDAVCREIRRILFYGDCYLQINCPELANRFIIVRGSRGGRIRKKLDQSGYAQIGPLLSDQEYAVTCRERLLFKEIFPRKGNGQILRLSTEKQKQIVREVEHYLPLTEQKKNIPTIMQGNILHSITLDPPLNNICRIDLLAGPFCVLTLINGRSFWIRKEAASRYGITHLVHERLGE